MATAPREETTPPEPPDVPLPYRGRVSPYVFGLMLFVFSITVSVIWALVTISRDHHIQEELLKASSASSVPWIIDDTKDTGHQHPQAHDAAPSPVAPVQSPATPSAAP